MLPALRFTLSLYCRFEQGCAAYLAPVAGLVVRLYLAQVFFKAGLSKLEDWDTTLFLFREEYRVPVLPPELAAWCGTAGELLFPLMLALGLAGRAGALGVFAVNAMAVWSYWHVLGLPEQVAGLTHHLLWGLLAGMLLAYGPGALSVDHLLRRWCGSLFKKA